MSSSLRICFEKYSKDVIMSIIFVTLRFCKYEHFGRTLTIIGRTDAKQFQPVF